MTTVEVAGEIGCHRSWVIKLVEQGFLRGERLQPVGPGLRRRWSIESASVEDLKTALRGRKPRRGPNKIKKRLEELRAAAGRGNGQPAPRNGQPVRAKKQRAAPRLQLDPLTHSVRLDDKLLGSDIRPKPFRFFERIAKANGDLVSGQELRKLPGLAGVMFFRLLDQLPLPVRRLVKSASRAGGGYWLQLPTKRCSSV
ncbi:MAG TPA: hypothetical protein VKD90_17575 [Gemmataceae bacterium]|nr:hypothetical protein [Gemmataceae bacterium]